MTPANMRGRAVLTPGRGSPVPGRPDQRDRRTRTPLTDPGGTTLRLLHYKDGQWTEADDADEED